MTKQQPKRILVLDDEKDVTDLIAYHLKKAGYEARTLNDPFEILGVAREFQPDLFILDVMMPEIDGVKLCRMLHADPAFVDTPIIFVTAKGEAVDRIKGLEAGADDYICKPFDIKELLLRISLILKRLRAAHPESGGVLKAASIILDTDRHTVRIDGDPIDLTSTEFKLLRLLMERKGRVQTRENLLVNVWNYETDTETRTVDTHIRRLREKLGAHADLIETIRGVGYRMNDSQSS